MCLQCVSAATSSVPTLVAGGAALLGMVGWHSWRDRRRGLPRSGDEVQVPREDETDERVDAPARDG